MSISVGIDIVQVARFEDLLSSGNVLNTVFSHREQKFSVVSLAGNWAIKESFIKAFGGKVPAFDLRDLEVLRSALGVPILDTPSELLRSYVNRVLSLSLAHDADYCIGVVIAQSEVEKNCE